MATIDGRAHFVITDTVRERIAASDRTYEVTDATMADATCRAFCAPRGLNKNMNAIQAEIHRRTHLEIARAVLGELR